MNRSKAKNICPDSLNNQLKRADDNSGHRPGEKTGLQLKSFSAKAAVRGKSLENKNYVPAKLPKMIRLMMHNLDTTVIFESRCKKVFALSADGTTRRCQGALQWLKNLLCNDARFIIIHESFIVQRCFIKRFCRVGKEMSLGFDVTKVVVPVSRQYHDTIDALAKDPAFDIREEKPFKGPIIPEFCQKKK